MKRLRSRELYGASRCFAVRLQRVSKAQQVASGRHAVKGGEGDRSDVHFRRFYGHTPGEFILYCGVK